MTLTRNATIFAAVNTLSTIIFLATLNHLINTQQFNEITPWAVTYGLVWAITGGVLGSTDKERNQRNDLDFQYATIQYAMAFLILWGTKIFLPAVMPYSYITLLIMSAIIGMVAFLHYMRTNGKLKIHNKKEAFK